MNILLEMSLSGALLIMVIALIRVLVMHKLPKRAFIVLWCVALFQLVIPFSIPSQASIFNLFGGNVQPVHSQAADLPNFAIPMQPAQPVTVIVPATANEANNSRPPAISLLILVYLSGVFISAILFTLLYSKNRKEFGTSLPISNEFILNWLEQHKLKRPISIRVSDKIAAPLTYGILRPVILLPKDADWSNKSELNYVLAHEFIHIKRFDALTKLVMAAALCVHWFNPIVWGMYALFNRDVEISCDEAVINMLGEQSKQGYALTLISMVERKSHLPALYNNFSKYAIEERITAIMKMKKGTIIGTIAALLIISVTATVFATSRTIEQAEESSTASFQWPVAFFDIQLERQAVPERAERSANFEETVTIELKEYLVYVEHPERNISFTLRHVYYEDELVLQPYHLSFEAIAKIAADAIYAKFGICIDGMDGHMLFVNNRFTGMQFWSGFIRSEELTTHSEVDELFHFTIDATTGYVTWLSMNTIEEPFRG